MLTDVHDLQTAIFLWFGSHYIFNMQYAKQVCDVGNFFQDFIFCIPGKVSRKPKYKSIVGDMKLFMQGTHLRV